MKQITTTTKKSTAELPLKKKRGLCQVCLEIVSVGRVFPLLAAAPSPAKAFGMSNKQMARTPNRREALMSEY